MGGCARVDWGAPGSAGVLETIWRRVGADLMAIVASLLLPREALQWGRLEIEAERHKREVGW